MRRGKRHPDAPLVEHEQCYSCGRFHAGPLAGLNPGAKVREADVHHISNTTCSGDCEQREVRRFHHSHTNVTLERAGYDPEPLPDELLRPWEREGRDEWLPAGWEPEGGWPDADDE